jgi:transcriptional regulator with PAS, ATPase and Fis domain
MRSKGPFVAVNCGALPETLLESEIFGYRKGAFTDAKRDKPGRFALAEGGTLFLDEIGDLSKGTQVKLLRVLEQKQYEPLGSTRTEKADVRIVAATHSDLATLVAKGEFREDLFYRLNVMKLEISPLRQRREDIPLLLEHFIRKLSEKTGKPIRAVSNRAMKILLEHDYPGNVRELENILEHAFILCKGTEIRVCHLPEGLFPPEDKGTPKSNPPRPARLSELEKEILVDALEGNSWDREQTARYLGMHRATLWRKMRRHGIEKP